MYTEQEKRDICACVESSKKENLPWSKILQRVKKVGYRQGSEDALAQFYKRYGPQFKLTIGTLPGLSHWQEDRRAAKWLRDTFQGPTLENLWRIYDKYLDNKLKHLRYTEEVDEKVAAELSIMAHFAIKLRTLQNFRIKHHQTGYCKGRRYQVNNQKLAEIATNTVPVVVTPPVTIEELAKQLREAEEQLAPLTRRISEIKAEMHRKIDEPL